MTYREYRDAAERAAAGLAELGVGEGTPVSWALPTWIESLVLVGALSRLGAVQNPDPARSTATARSGSSRSRRARSC